VILRNLELFIYGDIHYNNNVFLKWSAQVTTKYVMNYFLWALLKNYEKRLLASSRLSVSVCVSIRPHGTSRLKRDGFSLNLVLERFGEICQENLIFIKTGPLHENLRTFMVISHSVFLRIRNVSEKSCGEHQNVSKITIFRKSCRLWDNVGKIRYSLTGHGWK
jgi:hypothetical protein